MTNTPRFSTRPNSTPKTISKNTNLRPAREWVVGCVPMPAYVMENDEPYRPDVIIWIDVTSDLIIGQEIIKAGETPAAVIAKTFIAVKEKSGYAPPSTIRVADEALAAALRQTAGHEVRVEIAPVPEMDWLAASMAEYFAKNREPETYLEGGRISPAAMRHFFDAAADLWRAAPWEYIFDDELFRIDCPALGVEGKVVSVIGNLGKNLGVLIFDSLDDFNAVVEHVERPPAGGLFSINFERGAELPASMRKEVKRHGWRTAGAQAYPVIQFLDQNMHLRPLTERDVAFATACARALVTFLAAHGEAIEIGDFAGAEMSIGIDALPDRPVVALTAPYPGTVWDDDDDDFFEKDIEAMIAGVRPIVDAFLQAQRAADRGEEWLSAADFVLGQLHGFKLQLFDDLDEAWTAPLLSEFLLEYFPRKISASDDVIDKTPEVLVAFFQWAGQTGHVDAGDAEAICKRIKKQRGRFAREARDPYNFGPAKELFTAMQAAGVDVNDEAAIGRYIDGQASDGGPYPAEKKTKKPPRVRWVWSGEGAAPDLKAPCPCGSQKTYKKCCLPR